MIAMPYGPAAYGLHRPGDDLPERGREDEPEQHRPPGPGRGRPGPKRRPSTPSRTQAWIIHAMLSGASSSAPRWSVVGLIGYGDGLVAGDQLAATAGGDRRARR